MVSQDAALGLPTEPLAVITDVVVSDGRTFGLAFVDDVGLWHMVDRDGTVYWFRAGDIRGFKPL